MIYRKESMGGYNLHTIKTDKFKMCHIEIIFRNNAIKEEITIRNVLFEYLCECSKLFPTRRELLLKLEDLYGANIFSVNNRVGSSFITNFCLYFLNVSYTEKSVLEESIKTLFELILNPLVNNGEFDEKILNIVKKRIKNKILSVYENPKKRAIIDSLKVFKDSITSFSSVGNVDDLDLITPETLYKYYEKVIKHDYVDIYVIGNLDMDNVSKIINKYAKFNIIKNHDVSLYVNNKKIKEQRKSSYFKHLQTNVIFVLNLNKLTEYEKKYVANIYNIILGGGALDTKLYVRLRNDNSLCYNVNSYYQKYDNLILISTAVDINMANKAIKLIKLALNDMKSNITESELEKAKELLITSINISRDDIGRIIDNYYYRDISDLDSFEERIKTFKQVTIEDIYNFSKKVSVSCIYTLNGGEE